MNIGNYGWKGGEHELQQLQLDINFALAHRNLKQLVCYGSERPEALWFFDDCALGDAVTVKPDRERIFWYEGQGYTFLRNEEGFPLGDEGQAFRLMDFPKMRPDVGIQQALTGNLPFALVAGPDDPEALLSLTRDLATQLRDSYIGKGGSYDGYLLLAAVAAYVAAPDIYQQRGEFPGIWIVGEKGGGKTLSAKVAMALWGYARLDQAMSFKSSTTVNCIITLGQLANMPNWGDEYKEGQLKEDNVRNIVHCGFNREIPGKFSPDGTTRKIRTNFIVTGESTCANAATMDRYITLVAAKESWGGTQAEKQDRFQWLLAHRP